MTLKIYDVAIDEFREPMQKDIDRLCDMAGAYRVLRDTLKFLLEDLDKTAEGKQVGIAFDSTLKAARAKYTLGYNLSTAGSEELR